jgi:hypothetical protein
MRRTLAWALVTPLAAVGVLAGHAAAYTLTGADPGPAHEYLNHAPQVLVLLVPLGLLGLACQQRPAARPSMLPFALLAVAGFAAQEHVEHLAHTGQLPWLLTDPTFLAGLALQIPVALACLALARHVLGVLEAGGRTHRPPAGDIRLPLTLAPALVPAETRPARATGRGPPGAYVP